MSNLKPSMVGLDKGLNLQVAKIAAPVGSALDALNYEQVDFQGQKRIDGYTRFDGSHLAALDDYRVIALTSGAEGESPEFQTGDLIASDLGMFGVVVKVDFSDDYPVLYVAVTNENYLPIEYTQVYRIGDGQQDEEGRNISTSVLGSKSGISPEEHYELLLEFNSTIRSNVESLPGPVAGLHWFRDRLHAVAAVTYISLSGTTPQLYPGDVIVAGDYVETTVLDSVVLAGSRAVFVDSMNPDFWTSPGLEIFKDGDLVGTVQEGYEVSTIDEIASIFEARSEEQVLREDSPDGPFDFGWRFKHLGWKVYFDNGISLYGSLPALNQNIEGVGTLGPTSTADNNGAPAVLAQGLNTTNMGQQVNGWKSISSNTLYSPSPTDMQESDNEAVYADAYISWDGNSGALIGDTGTPTEYSPTNTVRIGS